MSSPNSKDRPQTSNPSPLALVTGASSGIGEAYAERLAREGYDLIVVARREERLQTLAQKLKQNYGVEVEVLASNLIEPQGLRSVEERIAGEERLEFLLNNAGFATTGLFAELNPDRLEAEVRLNVIAMMRLARAAIPGMVKQGRGVIVNVSSMAGFGPGPYATCYSATKSFVINFTEAICEELRGTGIKVQVLCPGPVDTEFAERAGLDTEKSPEYVQRFIMLRPEKVAEDSLSGLKKGKVVVVPGWLFRTVYGMSQIQRFYPRSLSRRISGWMGKRMWT